MAKTTPKTPAVVVGNTSERRGPGRPEGSKNKDKDSNGNKFDYSRFKLTFRKPADFAGFLAGYPDKRALQAYIYRLRPRIDNSLIGVNESAIFTTHNESEMREDYIASVYGRGHYQLKLSDANRAPGQTEVCKVWFEIEDPEVKPAVYDPRTLLVSEPKNQDEVSRLLLAGILIDDNGRIRVRSSQDAPHTPAPVAAAPAPAVAQQPALLEQTLLAELIRGLVSRGAQSPSDAVRDTIAVAKMLNPQTETLNVEQIVESVVKRLQGTNPQHSELGLLETYERVDKFLRRATGRGGDDVTEVTGTVLTGAAPAGDSMNAWAPHATGILQQLRGLMAEGMVMYNHMRNNRGPQQPNAPQQPVQQQQPQRLPEQMTMPERIEEIALLAFDKMLGGVKGFDFAAFVCNFHPGGREVFDALEPVGRDGVIGLASMNPATLPFVTQHRAQLEEFLDEFFSFAPDGVEDDSEPEPEPAAAPPPPRSGRKAAAKSA